MSGLTKNGYELTKNPVFYVGRADLGRVGLFASSTDFRQENPLKYMHHLQTVEGGYYPAEAEAVVMSTILVKSHVFIYISSPKSNVF